MKKTKAVFLDHETVDLGDLDLTSLREGPYEWCYFPKGNSSKTLERINSAEVVITNKVALNRQHSLPSRPT